MVFGEDPSKSMITLANYLMKRRKWPYQGWHKRFFQLENGYIIYGKSEQSVNIVFFFSLYVNSKYSFLLGKTWSIKW
jgi:hypothetical protein